MNGFTRSALMAAFQKDPKLRNRPFRQIENAALSAYYDLFLLQIGQPAIERAVRLYYQFQPDCVTKEGRDTGEVECDECAYRLSEAVEHYLYEWYLYQHPEYDWTGFTEVEARDVLALFEQVAESERAKKTTYQMALF